MEIRNGLFIKTRNGSMGVVFNNTIIYKDGKYDKLSNFNSNGENCVIKELDIVAIYDCICFNDMYDKYIIWKPLNKTILDDREKEYLSAVIKPFRDRVISIYLIKDTGSCFRKKRAFITIELSLYSGFTDIAYLPTFEFNTMYKNMIPNKHYTLEELGL